MAYKKIKEVLIVFDGNFMNECRMFEYGGGEYLCKSKSKKKQMENCNLNDCPMVFDCSLEELKTHDKHLYEEYKGHFKKELSKGVKEEDLYPSHIGNLWAIQYKDFI